MPSKSWGTPQLIQNYVVVGENDEIPAGQKAYVFQQSSKEYDKIWWEKWETFMQGDISLLKDEIENAIPYSKVLWLSCSWVKVIDKNEYPYINYYKVYGFKVEALVENTGEASLTGLEIALIIVAFGFLFAVVALTLTGAWVVWQVMSSIPDLAKPFVGIGILILILLFLLVLFGRPLAVSRKGAKIG